MWTEGHFAGVSEPSVALHDEIETLLNAHPNWEHAGELEVSSYLYQTWRCIGEEDEGGSGNPGNGFGEDFYIVLRYHENGTTQHFRMGAFEIYDHGAGQVTHPCVNLTSATVPESNGSFGGPYAIQHANNVFKHEAQIDTLGIFDYWVLVANDGVYIGTRVGGNDYGIYAGLFESLMDVDPFPLVVTNVLATSSNQTSTTDANNALRGYWSRHPVSQESNVRNFKVNHFNGELWTSRTGQIGNYGDAFHSGRVIGGRYLVCPVGVTSGDASSEQYGRTRGLYNHFLYFNVPAGVVQGDNITVEGNEYHYVGGSTHAWVNKDAD